MSDEIAREILKVARELVARDALTDDGRKLTSVLRKYFKGKRGWYLHQRSASDLLRYRMMSYGRHIKGDVTLGEIKEDWEEDPSAWSIYGDSPEEVYAVLERTRKKDVMEAGKDADEAARLVSRFRTPSGRPAEVKFKIDEDEAIFSVSLMGFIGAY